MSLKKDDMFENMEDFEALLNKNLQQPSRGDVVKAVIQKIDNDNVIVNFGYKTEGIIDKSEFKEEIKVGDTVDLSVLSFAGGSYVQLTRKSLNSDSDWEELKGLGEGSVISVKVTGKVDKGYVGKVEDIDAFIPESHISTQRGEVDAKQFIGKTFKAEVLKFGEGRRRSVLVSPRLFAQHERAKDMEKAFALIKVGDKVKGTVRTIKDYGVFVNLGAVDGFVHRGDIVWQRVKSAEGLLSVGDNIEAIVIDVKAEDKKISLSMKALKEDPFDAVEKLFPLEKTVSGLVAVNIHAGFIIDLGDGIEGIVPKDEVSWVKNSRVELKPKTSVDCKIIGYDKDRRRVILSLKALGENPWDTIVKERPEGSTVKCKVKNITEFGLFVDFGYSIDGLIRKSDISWDDSVNITEAYNVGSEVDAKIIKIDLENERIALSIKHLENNPWSSVNSDFAVGKTVKSVIKNVTKQGIETELAPKVKGFIGLTDLSNDKQSLDNYHVNDEITANVTKIDNRARVVYLSVKKFVNDAEKKDTKDYMKKMANTDAEFRFGSIFKDKLEK